MGILAINTQFPGQVGVPVRRVPMISTDDLATVTTAGYLNPATLLGNVIYPTDIIVMWYNYVSNRNPGTYAEFVPSFNAATQQITLTLFSNVNEVTFIGSPIIGNLPSVADLNGNIQDSGIVANTVLYTSFATPDTNSNIFVIPASSIDATSLNSGAVSIFTPTGSKTYRVLAARAGGSGNTNFSGGGGDRNLVVQMGSTAYASIPAATAQAIATVPLILGAGTAFVYVNSGNFSQNITAAAPLQLAYAGGTTNYSLGNVSIEFLIQRIS